MRSQQQTTSTDDIDQTVTAVCGGHPEIKAAYLFGSTARGERKPKSDVDVALLVSPEQGETFSQIPVISELEDALKRPADVVVLNRCSEIIKFHVRRDGRLLLDCDPDFRKSFEIRGRKSWEDFLYLHKRYVDVVLYGKPYGR
jgi:uncharacterized protein